ncbi:hypothetical protein BHE74_00008116 [Ensete ventricosum]|nr:hypothetical protein BHE74_00008116 [Ensete ventricosum]
MAMKDTAESCGSRAGVESSRTHPRRQQQQQQRHKLEAYAEVLRRLRKAGRPEVLSPSFEDGLLNHFNRLPERGKTPCGPIHTGPAVDRYVDRLLSGGDSSPTRGDGTPPRVGRKIEATLGIGPSSDDVVGSRLKFARRFAEGIGKLAGNAKGDRREEDGRICRKIVGSCWCMRELGLNYA